MKAKGDNDDVDDGEVGDEEEVGDRGGVDGESFEFFAADFGCDSHPRSLQVVPLTPLPPLYTRVKSVHLEVRLVSPAELFV